MARPKNIFQQNPQLVEHQPCAQPLLYLRARMNLQCVICLAVAVHVVGQRGGFYGIALQRRWHVPIKGEASWPYSILHTKAR